MFSMFAAVLAAAAAAAAAATAAPAPGAQPDPAAQTAQAAAPAKPAKPKLVCRTNQVTGSRLGAERICKTQVEWDNIARDARDNFDNQLRHGLNVSCPSKTGC